MSTTSPVKVGLIGFGNSANVYNLPYLLPCKDLHLHAILQRKSPSDPKLGQWGHCTDDKAKQRLQRWGVDKPDAIVWYQDQEKVS